MTKDMHSALSTSLFPHLPQNLATASAAEPWASETTLIISIMGPAFPRWPLQRVPRSSHLPANMGPQKQSEREKQVSGANKIRLCVATLSPVPWQGLPRSPFAIFGERKAETKPRKTMKIKTKSLPPQFKRKLLSSIYQTKRHSSQGDSHHLI